jgi:hypothetical protein
VDGGVVRRAAGRRRARAGDLGGEVAALDDGWGVGAVVGEDLFEDVSGLFGCIGDDEELVVLAAAGDGDVEPAVTGGWGDHAEADIDGVAFVAVAGGGVAEPHVRPGIVGGERHLAVSVLVGHGEAGVPADVEGGPEVAVADGFAPVGAERAVVAAGGHHVADGRCLTACYTDGPVAELAVRASLRLNGGVEAVDVFVGFGDHGDAAAGGDVGDPSAGRFGDEFVERAGGDAAVADVGVKGVGVAGP